MSWEKGVGEMGEGKWEMGVDETRVGEMGVYT